MKERIDKANTPDMSSGEISKQKAILENLQKDLQIETGKKQTADQHAQKGSILKKLINIKNKRLKPFYLD